MAIIKTTFSGSFKPRKRKLIITLTPDDQRKMNISGANDFDDVEIFDMVNTIYLHFADLTIKRYIHETGDRNQDQAKFAAWLDMYRRKHKKR